MSIGAVFRCVAVLIVVLVLQVELFADVRIWGIMPELLLGVSIAGAWAGGADRGAIIGFSAGMLYDLYLPTPLALSALTYALVAYAVGLVSEGVAQSGEATLRRMVSFVAVPVGITLFVVTGELLGQDLYGDGFTRLIIVASLYTLALMGLLHWLMGWAFAERDAARTPMKLELVE